jgi:hypothetical protein
MDEKQRLKHFKAWVEENRNSPDGHVFEETDGSSHRWGDLSAAAKLQYIASYAARWDVPFERFAETARAELGGEAAVTEAALWVALDYRKELRGLAKLIPEDHPYNSSTESVPLVEQFQEMLGYPPAQRAGLIAYDTAEGVKTELESFGDEFERLARTAEQKELAAAFKGFVGEVTAAGMRETFDTLLRRFAEGERQAPEAGSDRGIER